MMKSTLRDVPATPQNVESPVRAFLADGSVVVFLDGATVSDRAIVGAGERYDLLRQPIGTVGAVLLDSVLGLEAFDRTTDVSLSILASLGTTVLVVAGSVALICAADPKCFGSCPTIYSTHEGEETLEAEAFSYSISPLLEGRDMDRLSVAASEAGWVELEIRNEALETHFINHLELVEVRHAAGQRVVTDEDNVPAVVSTLNQFDRVIDRDGRDVADDLSARDERVFASSPDRVDAAGAGDPLDWLEATLPPIAGDTAAIVLRLRNSLLNTVLFYEFMLGAQGARALDWMARDIEEIGTAIELGSWFHRTMGLRLEVETEAGFQEVSRFGDTGPIAWKEVTFRVPVRKDAPTRFRLSFLADEWRIDHMTWSASITEASTRTIPVHRITPLVGSARDDLEARVAAADDTYLVTSGGSGFRATFDVGPEPDGEQRTFLLASQGYYTEWVRPTWIRGADKAGPFRPTDSLVPDLMKRWKELQGPMEEAFHATRIPVR
ncbi:MAG: hypothetical protein ABFS34_15370 [Gemmatimonadota bacterium]